MSGKGDAFQEGRERGLEDKSSPHGFFQSPEGEKAEAREAGYAQGQLERTIQEAAEKDKDDE